MNEHNPLSRATYISRIVGVTAVLSFVVFSIAFTLVSLTPIVWNHVIGVMVGVIVLVMREER